MEGKFMPDSLAENGKDLLSGWVSLAHSDPEKAVNQLASRVHSSKPQPPTNRPTDQKHANTFVFIIRLNFHLFLHSKNTEIFPFMSIIIS